MPLCYVVVLICYVVFGFCSIFFTFSLYYSVVQKWRLSSVFGGFSLTPPLGGGDRGGWAAGQGIGSRAAHCAAGRSRGRRRRTRTQQDAGRQPERSRARPRRARGQGRHRRRRTTSHPDVWVRSSSAGGSTPGRSGSPPLQRSGLGSRPQTEGRQRRKRRQPDVRRAGEIDGARRQRSARDPPP